MLPITAANDVKATVAMVMVILVGKCAVVAAAAAASTAGDVDDDVINEATAINRVSTAVDSRLL